MTSRALVLAVATVTLVAIAVPAAAQPRAASQLREPVVLVGDRVALVAGPPELLAAAGDSAGIARTLASCGVAAIPDEALRRLMFAPGVPARGDRIVFVVLPAVPAPPACEVAATRSAALMVRGIRVAADARLAPQPLLTGVQLRVGDGVARTDSVERLPAVLVTAAGDARDAIAPSILVVTVPADAFSPDARGAIRDVAIDVARADGAAGGERLTMYEHNVRRIWYQLLPGRLASAPADARAAAERLLDGALAREDERTARLAVADALLAGGDSIAARVLLGDVLREAPCLVLASATPARARLLDDLRPRDVRCTVTPASRVVLASLVPGLGQAVTGRPRLGWSVAGGTALLGAISLGLRMAGNSKYDDYQAATSADLAEDSYSTAAQLRTASTGVAGAAALAWLLAGVDAIRHERAHRAEVERQRDYGRRTRVSARMTPGITPGALHMGVAFTW